MQTHMRYAPVITSKPSKVLPEIVAPLTRPTTVSSDIVINTQIILRNTPSNNTSTIGALAKLIRTPKLNI